MKDPNFYIEKMFIFFLNSLKQRHWDSEFKLDNQMETSASDVPSKKEAEKILIAVTHLEAHTSLSHWTEEKIHSYLRINVVGKTTKILTK